jgi:hypothetical protein
MAHIKITFSIIFLDIVAQLPASNGAAKIMFGMRATNGITWHWISQLIEFNWFKN